MRRDLKLATLDDTVLECRRLALAGYKKSGNWTLGQICNHLRITIDANMHGYPTWMTILGYPLRPLLRRVFLPRLLSGNSPRGVPTSGIFIPPKGLCDASELDKLEKCVSEFNQFPGSLHPHPGFGKMTRTEFNEFHAAHAAHHLSFLGVAEE